MTMKALCSACGLRVNCTADASARCSRRRETAACSRRPATQADAARDENAERDELDARRALAAAALFMKRRARSVMTHRPKIHAVRRMLIFMSPLRMWLNSWPITACNWSRSNASSAPCVTATAASSGEWPAANALMPGSSGSTNTCGLRMRAAMAISSTMFTQALALEVAVVGGRPARRPARAPPPRRRRAAASCDARTRSGWCRAR